MQRTQDAAILWENIRTRGMSAGYQTMKDKMTLHAPDKLLCLLLSGLVPPPISEYYPQSHHGRIHSTLDDCSHCCASHIHTLSDHIKPRRRSCDSRPSNVKIQTQIVSFRIPSRTKNKNESAIYRNRATPHGTSLIKSDSRYNGVATIYG